MLYNSIDLDVFANEKDENTDIFFSCVKFILAIYFTTTFYNYATTKDTTQDSNQPICPSQTQL